MSITYYDLRYPWTLIETRERFFHTTIRIWESDKSAGTIVVTRSKTIEAAKSFFETSVDGCYHQARTKEGLVYTRIKKPRGKTVMDERGEIFSVLELEELVRQSPIGLIPRVT